MIWTDPRLLEQLPVLGWPLVMLLAWLFGEWAHRRLQLPRIACYSLIGFVAGSGQLGWLAASGEAPMALLAHIAFGLLLFEFGYRVNLRWFLHNPALLLAGLLDALLSFVAVYLVAQALGSNSQQAALMAALGMAASPATLVRVLQEQRAAGQISERLVHVAALNCLLAVIVFKAVLGVSVFEASGSLAGALYTGAWASLVSAGLVAWRAAAALAAQSAAVGDRSLPYALALLALVGATHVLQLSPIVAALVFGIVARHRREVFSRHTRGFGPLGDLLALALFVYLGSRLEWDLAMAGLGAGALLVLARLLATCAVMTAFARWSGISWRKGALTGLGLMPLSAFALPAAGAIATPGPGPDRRPGALDGGAADPRTAGPGLHAAGPAPGRRAAAREVMSLLPFADSDSLSFGVELELQLINLSDYDLSAASTDLLALLQRAPFPGQVTPEITTSMIEVATSVQTRHGPLQAQLREMRDTLLAAAASSTSAWPAAARIRSSFGASSASFRRRAISRSPSSTATWRSSSRSSVSMCTSAAAAATRPCSCCTRCPATCRTSSRWPRVPPMCKVRTPCSIRRA